jgi:hypothetical protein
MSLQKFLLQLLHNFVKGGYGAFLLRESHKTEISAAAVFDDCEELGGEVNRSISKAYFASISIRLRSGERVQLRNKEMRTIIFVNTSKDQVSRLINVDVSQSIPFPLS